MGIYKYKIIENADEYLLHGIYDDYEDSVRMINLEADGEMDTEEPENVTVVSAENFPDWQKLMETLENEPEKLQELKSTGMELDDEVSEDSFIDTDVEEEKSIRENLKKLNVKPFEDINSIQFLKIPENAMQQDRTMRNFLEREGISTAQLYIIQCDRSVRPVKSFPIPENIPVILRRNQRLIGFDRQGCPHLVQKTADGLVQKKIWRLEPGQNGKAQQVKEDEMLKMIGYQVKESSIDSEWIFKEDFGDKAAAKQRTNIIVTMIALHHPELIPDMSENVVENYGAAFDCVKGLNLNRMGNRDLAFFLSEDKNYREVEKKADTLAAKQLRKDLKEREKRSSHLHKAIEQTLDRVCENLYVYLYGNSENLPASNDQQEYEKNIIKNTEIFKRFENARFRSNLDLDGLALNGLNYPEKQLVQQMIKKEYASAEKTYIHNIYKKLKISTDASPEMKEIQKCMKNISDYSTDVPGNPDADIMRQKLGQLYQRCVVYASEKGALNEELEDVRLLLNNGRQKYHGTWEQIEKEKPVREIVPEEKNLFTWNTERTRNAVRTAWESVRAQSIWMRGSKQYGELYRKLEEFDKKIANGTVRENEFKDNIEQIWAASKSYLNIKVEGGSYKGDGSDVSKATAGVGERRFAAAESVYRTMTELLHSSRQNKPDKGQPEAKEELQNLMIQWNRQMERVKATLPEESPLHQIADSVKKHLGIVVLKKEENNEKIFALVSMGQMQKQIANLDENLHTEEMKQMQKTLSDIQKVLGEKLNPEEKREIEALEQMPSHNTGKVQERKSLQPEEKQERAKAMGK